MCYSAINATNIQKSSSGAATVVGGASARHVAADGRGRRGGREHTRSQRHAARLQPQHQPQLVLHQRVAESPRCTPRTPARAHAPLLR